MRVARLVAPRKFELFDEPLPIPAAEEALLRIEAVGICGSDLHRFRGVAFKDEDNGGLVLGHEFSATVEAIGENVQQVRPGDRVAVEAANHCGNCEWCRKGLTNICPNVRFCGMPGVDGALREFMAWPAHLLHKLPRSLDFNDGVLAEVLGIGLHSIDLASMHAGMIAAVLGAGPVGLGVVHLLRRISGARFIIADDQVEARCQAAIRLGANGAINASRENVYERIMAATLGRGVDVVFEAAGVDETCDLSVQIAAPGGKIILIGIPEDDRCAFAAGPARRKGLTVKFVRRSLMTYGRILSLMQKGIIEVRSMVTHHFSLENVQQAFELADGYRDGVLKAIIHVRAEKQGNSWD